MIKNAGKLNLNQLKLEFISIYKKKLRTFFLLSGYQIKLILEAEWFNAYLYQ